MSEEHDDWMKAALGLDVAKIRGRSAQGPNSPPSPALETELAPDSPARDDAAAQKRALTEEFTGLSARLKEVGDRANQKNKQDLLALTSIVAERLKSGDIGDLQVAMDDLRTRLSEVAASHEAQDKARVARGGRMASLSRNIQKLMNELA